MSPEKLLLPKKPRGARLFAGDLSAYIQREVDAAFERGRDEALGGTCNLMAQAARRIDHAREEALLEIPAFTVRFIEEVARQLLHIELGEQRHDIEKMVRETLAQSGVGRGECTVHVNPRDMERLTPSSFRRGTEIQADPEVQPGCVQITTPQGLLVRDVDLCIKHASERIHEHLRQNAYKQQELERLRDPLDEED